MPNTVQNSCCQMEIPFEFLDVQNHPTPRDLERNMSKKLVDVYLETCTPIERTLFGRDKTLKGPEKLWINPDDRSDGNETRLTPIRTESVQALTHQGILEIGKQIEEKMFHQSQKIIGEAVVEAEELAKFEANLRIQFHVEIETKKLNEEWQVRVNQLMVQHDSEKKCLMKLYEDGRALLQEFITKKCKQQFEKLMSKAVAEANIKMDENCAKLIDVELMQQSALVQEQMENTIRNLEANNRNRMEEMKSQCLNAMDLQNHLLVCRQITEMMHMMSLEKRHWRMKMKMKTMKADAGEFRNDSETMTKPDQSHQSKSINLLLMEFLHQLNDFDAATLDADEKKTFTQILRVLDELKMEQGHLNANQSGEVIVIQEPSEPVKEIHEKDWIDRHDEVCSKMHQHTEISSLIDIKWEKFESNTDKVQSDTSFVASVFNSFTQPQHCETTKVASFIIRMVKTSKDDTQLLGNVAQMIQDVIMKKLFPIEPSSPYVGLVPMPKTEALKIKDSLETMEKRVSIQENQIESHQLLAVVDSLELVSKSTSRADSKKSSTVTADVKRSSAQFESIFVPTYMKTSNKPNWKPYMKMTEDDWIVLEKAEKSKKIVKPARESSVQFDETESHKSSRRISQRSSILKRSSQERENQFEAEQNALHSIQEKVREALNNIESVLKILCNDDDIGKD